jgi:hypothetical protein
VQYGDVRGQDSVLLPKQPMHASMHASNACQPGPVGCSGVGIPWKFLQPYSCTCTDGDAAAMSYSTYVLSTLTDYTSSVSSPQSFPIRPIL